MSEDGGLRQFLFTEYDQAWTHYRHVENQRAQYLGFFFTVALGSVTFAIPLIGGGSMEPWLQLIAAALFLMAFQSFTFFMFVSLHKFGMVLAHYGDAMKTLRGLIAENVNAPAHAASAIGTDDSTHLRGPRVFAVQGTAEKIVQGFALAAALVSALIFTKSLMLGNITSTLFTTAGLLIAATSAVFILRQSRS